MAAKTGGPHWFPARGKQRISQKGRYGHREKQPLPYLSAAPICLGDARVEVELRSARPSHLDPSQSSYYKM